MAVLFQQPNFISDQRVPAKPLENLERLIVVAEHAYKSGQSAIDPHTSRALLLNQNPSIASQEEARLLSVVARRFTDQTSPCEPLVHVASQIQLETAARVLALMPYSYAASDLLFFASHSS